MILASILSTMFAILSGIVLVRTGSQPVAELAYIFMIVSSAAMAASAIGLTLAREEPKVPRATSVKIAIGAMAAVAAAPLMFMGLAIAALFSAPFFLFSPVIPAWLHPYEVEEESHHAHPTPHPV